MTTADDVKREVEENFNLEELVRDSIAALEKEGIPAVLHTSKMLHLFVIGEWLHWKMVQNGATEKEAKDQSFAAGQLCMLGDPYDVAAKVFDKWLAGKPLTPGRKLGEEIADEFLEGLKR